MLGIITGEERNTSGQTEREGPASVGGLRKGLWGRTLAERTLVERE
jgi:hypothetical protein